MALYFVVMVPLARRIQLGLYRDGVWADSGFLPYAEIARMAFREGEEIVLVLLPRGSRAAFRLPVPPGEYGAVRRFLQDKIRCTGPEHGRRDPRPRVVKSCALGV